MKQLLKKHPQHLAILKVNTSKHSTFARLQGVRSIPDVRIYQDNRRLASFVGMRSQEQISKMISPHIKKITSKAASKKESKSDPNTPSSIRDQEPQEEPMIQPLDKNWLPKGVQRIESSHLPLQPEDSLKQ